MSEPAPLPPPESEACPTVQLVDGRVRLRPHVHDDEPGFRKVCFVVSLLGVVVAAGLRNQLLVRERLPFPSGVVTAETMSEIHQGGRESHARLRVLALTAGASATLKTCVSAFNVMPIAPGLQATLTTASGKPLKLTATNLGFALDPSVLMVGFGAIAGLRIGISLLIGAVLGWALLAPLALSNGWAEAGEASTVWFAPLVEWLLWPGATLMVSQAVLSMTEADGKADAPAPRPRPMAVPCPPAVMLQADRALE